ncbi:MAG: tetratricopeptide repeat protein [Haliscomenobacter sp.]|nr:tetratricopeptide repeat protein [Haliscomenobacter sp.]
MPRQLPWFLLLALVFPCMALSQKPPYAPLSELEVLVEKGEYTQAIREAQLALEQGVPADSVPLYLLVLGKAFLEEGDAEAARNQYQGVVDMVKGRGKVASLIRADAWNGLGEYYLKTGNWAKAMEYYRQALNVREALLGVTAGKTADSYNNLGNCFLESGDYQQALRYHLRAKELRDLLLPSEHPDLAVSLNNLGSCYLFLGNYAESIRLYQEALDLRIGVLGERHPKTAQVHNNLGRAYLESGNYEQALQHLKQALDIRNEQFGEGHPALAPLYENIGDVLLDQFEVREAETYFRQAETLYTEDKPSEKAAVQHKIGLCLQARGEAEEAVRLHLEALAVFEKQYGMSHPYLAPVLSNLGNGFLHQGQYREALPYLKRASGIFHKVYPAGHPDLAQCLNSIALCHLQLKQPSTAIAVLKEVTTLLQNREVYTLEGEALALKHQAMAESALGRPKAALAMVRSALGLLWPDRNTNRVNRVLAPEILALLVLESKYIRKTGGNPQAAAGLLETALQLSNRLRLRLSEDGRTQWAEAAFALYASAVETNFQAWKQTAKISYLERAFQLSEQYKGQTLLDAIRQTQALSFNGIPVQRLIDKRDLESELSMLEKQQWVAAQQGLSEREAELNRRIFDLRQQIEKLRKQLVDASPEYARLFEYARTPSVSALRRALDPDQGLIEYFTSDSLVFVFVMTPDTLLGVQMKKDYPLEAWVADFREMIKAYPMLSGAELTRESARWCKRSGELYRRLLLPVAGQVKLPERLVVVPDGILHYLPFEPLLSKTPGDPTRFKTHAYFGNAHSLSYAYSADLLRELKSVKPRGRFWGKYLLTMAPDFARNSFNLPPLQFNRQESDAARKLLGGRQLKGREASLYNFLSLAPEYRVLHLATHGKAAPGYQEFSYLAFTERPDNKDNEFLYARDLYSMELKCDLVVLSACETSVGAYRHGEGILGLGRGFFYAGAQSIMGTLWSVDDARTSSLVQRTFFYLRKGIPKDVALYRAKLDFLQEHAHDEAHPFYWSGLLLNGDTHPLPDPRLQWVITWLLALSGLGLALTLYWRWIRKRSFFAELERKNPGSIPPGANL